MTGPADDPTGGPVEDGADWSPVPGAWRGGDVWEFAERLADPPDADFWNADPTAPDPPRGFTPYAWWRWQQAGANPDDQPPRTGP